MTRCARAVSVGDRFRIVGLSLSDHGLRQALEEHPLPFEIYTNPAGEAVTRHGLMTTSQTIVLSPDGLSERAWTGAYLAGQKSAVERYFGIRLPG